VDNLRDPDSFVVVRYGYCLYDGRSDPYFACNCYNSGAGTRHSRAEGPVKREIPACNQFSSIKKGALRCALFSKAIVITGILGTLIICIGALHSGRGRRRR
jgi:hypothetical protein